MPSDVSAVQIWLRWSVPWWSACASRTPSGAKLSDPSSRCRTTTRSGSRSPRDHVAQIGAFVSITARIAARSIVVLVDRLRPPSVSGTR